MDEQAGGAGSDEAVRAHESSAIVAIGRALIAQHPEDPSVPTIKANAWAIVRALNEAGYVIVKVKGPALSTEITDA